MAKYDVYPNPDGAGYLLDVQSDLLDALNTRVVVPLMTKSDAPKPAEYLNPIFKVDSEEVVMVTQFLAAVPARILKAPVATLDVAHDQITRAIDMLHQGF